MLVFQFMKGNLGRATIAIVLALLLVAPFLVFLVPSKTALASPDSTVYDFNETDSNKAWYEYTQNDNPDDPPPTASAATSGMYDNIKNDDTSFWITDLTGEPDESDYQYYKFEISEDVSEIDNIIVKWIGYNSAAVDVKFSAWKNSATSWILLDEGGASSSEAELENDLLAIDDNASHWLKNDNEIWLHTEAPAAVGSCPVLYTWNGENKEYIYPISVNSGLSFPGYEVPESFKEKGWLETPFQIPKPLGSTIIQDGQLSAENGYYRLWIAEEMDEITYTDSVKLFAIYQYTNTEAYSSLPIVYQEFYPEFPYFHTVESPIHPIEAYNQDGEDILEYVTYPDEVWTNRTPGQEYYQTTVSFGELRGANTFKLIIKADTSWFNSPPFKLPFLEYWDGREWIRVTDRPDSVFEGGEEVGPGPTIVWDITDWLPRNLREYKLRFNDWQGKSYDYIAIDTSKDSYVALVEIPLENATHFYKGRGRFYDDAYHFDDTRKTHSTYEGYFTKYGDVSEVVSETDDMFVISNPGDAIEVNFRQEYSTLDALVELGYLRRSFLLLSDSYFKASFIKGVWFENTEHLELEPLPFHGMSYYPYPENESFPWDNEHLEWWDEYQTRYVSGKIEHDTLYSDYVMVEVFYTPAAPPVLPTQPTLYSPSEGSTTLDNTPDFEWENGENADNHRILIWYTDNIDYVDNEVIVGDNTWSETSGYVNENYSWKVIAVNDNGENVSDNWTFLVNVIYPTQPILNTPSDGDNVYDSTPYFEWENGENATSHRILVDNDPDFTSLELQKVLVDNKYISENILPIENYSWKVVAESENGDNTSTVWTFLIQLVPPPQPTLYVPVDDVVRYDNTPLFKWSWTENTDNWRLEVDIDPPDWASLEENRIVTDNWYEIALENSLNRVENYAWRVTSLSENGENTSDVWKFDLVENIADSFGYSGSYTDYDVAGEDNIVGSIFTAPASRQITGIWAFLEAGGPGNIKTAIYYDNWDLVAETGEKTVGAEIWVRFPFDPPPSVVQGEDYILVVWSEELSLEVYYHTGTSNQGHYDTAIYNGFPDPATFTTDDKEFLIYAAYQSPVPAPTTPQLLSPDNNSVLTSVPNLTWTTSGWADEFRLLVDNDEDLASPFENKKFDNIENSYQLGELGFGDYWWKVIAIGNGEASSDVFKFSLPGGTTGLGDFLIISRVFFFSQVSTFQELKENQGFTVLKAYWDWIDATYEGLDDAEKMRNAIKAYRDNGVEYVVIMGAWEFENVALDYTLPMRRMDANGLGPDWAVPFYFSNLDGNFDNDMDNVFGEWNGEENENLSPFVNAEVNENEEMDWFPDIYVGWFIADTVAEMTDIVQKNVDWTPYPDIDNVIGFVEDPNRYDQNPIEWWASWGYVNTLWKEENWWIDDPVVENDPLWRDQFLPTSINPIVGHMGTGQEGEDNRDNNFGGTGLSFQTVLADNNSPFLSYMGEIGDVTSLKYHNAPTKSKVMYIYGCISVMEAVSGIAGDLLSMDNGGAITLVGSSTTLMGYDWWESGYNRTTMTVADKALMTSFWMQFFRHGETRPGVAFYEAFRELLRESTYPMIETLGTGFFYLYNRRAASMFFLGDPSLQAVEVQWKQSENNYEQGVGQDNLAQIRNELEGIVGRYENWESTVFEDNFFTFENIGTSVQGRDIVMMSFGEGTKNILIRGAIHGNEHEGAVAVMNFVNWFATRMNVGEPYPDNMTSSANWDGEPRITLEDRAWRSSWTKVAYENLLENDFLGWLQNLRFHVIPVINPDGWVSNDRYNANGVDLNRNFPTAGVDEPDQYWAYHENNWGDWDTVDGENTQPEMWALLNQDEDKKFTLELGYHSIGQDIIYPWAMPSNFEEPYVIENVPLHKWYEEIGALIEAEQDDNDPYKVWQCAVWLQSEGTDNVHSSVLDWFAWENKHYYDGTQSELQGIRTFVIELYGIDEHSYNFVNQLPYMKVLLNWAKDYQAFFVDEEPVDWEYFELSVPITSNGDNLDNIDNIRVWIYKDSRLDPDDVTNHYTFEWERTAGFSEPSYPATSPHLIEENSVAFDSSLQKDNIMFALALETPKPGLWQFGAKVWDYEINQVVESSYSTGFSLPGPEITDLIIPNTVSPKTNFNVQVEIKDFEGLELVDNIIIKLFENVKTQGDDDNIRNHYTFMWSRGNDFEEVGPDGESPYAHIVEENCIAGDNTKTEDYWTFQLNLSGAAAPESWNVYVQVADTNDVYDNVTYLNEFSVNKHFELEQSTDTLRFGGYPGSQNNASYQNPVTLTITTNYNFSLTVKISGTFTNENENIWFENSDGGASRFKLTTSAQSSYPNVSWGKDVILYEYYFIDIPIEIGPGKYFTDFYTEYVEA